MSKNALIQRQPFFLMMFVIAFLSLVQGTEATPAPSFMGLGGPTGANTHNQAFAVSADGSVVVGWGGGQAFRWTQGGGMQFIGSQTTLANGVSADGSVIVGYGGVGSSTQAFRWTQQSGLVGLGYLPGSPRHFSRAYGISADGKVIVGTSARTSIDDDPVRWTDSGVSSLGDVPGTNGGQAEAKAVSADGSVIVGNSPFPTVGMAFRWTENSGLSLLGGVPVGFNTQAAGAVSSDGSVIVGYTRSPNTNPAMLEAYRWTPSGGLQPLGDLPGGDYHSIGWGISGDGQIAVGEGTTDSVVAESEAFIWDQTYQMRNLRDMLVNNFGLDLTGWTLNSARAISTDGTTIVGYGVNPSGFQEAWRAVIPEPSVLSLMMFAFSTGLLCKKRGKQRSHHH